MKKYTDIDIQYIQKKIRQTVWENHNYIDDLIILAEYIKNPPNGYIANMQFSLLKFHNKQEYLDLLQELNPRKYEFEL